MIYDNEYSINSNVPTYDYSSADNYLKIYDNKNPTNYTNYMSNYMVIKIKLVFFLI